MQQQKISIDTEIRNYPRTQLDLSTIPSRDQRIKHAMFDLTLRCNLRCRYCFKEKDDGNMSLRVAQDAIIWLIYASGSEKIINVFFLGGEPLLQSDLLKKLIPFGTQRAKSHGKIVRFGITTNGTLITNEIIRFSNQNRIAFHLSTDGIPKVQDYNRPLSTGEGSSYLVKNGAEKILTIQPNTMARASVLPENVPYLLESFHYFRELGFTTIGFFPCETHLWSKKAMHMMEQQLLLIGDEFIRSCRSHIKITLAPLERWFTQKSSDKRSTFSCGSGRGLVLIDTCGGIWPCSRFSCHDDRKWKLGSIYEEFSEKKREVFLEGCPIERFHPECDRCIATKICVGGCMAENLEVMGDIYKMPPNDCELNRIIARVGTYIHDTLYAEKNPIFMKRYYLQEWTEIEKATSSKPELTKQRST